MTARRTKDRKGRKDREERGRSGAPKTEPAPASPPTPRRTGGIFTAFVVAGLLALYAFLAMTAAVSKSPTYDEPLHAVSAWLQIHESDFRVDPEDPPLWKWWAGAFTSRDAIKADLKLPPGEPIPQSDAAEPVQIDPRAPHAVAMRYRLVAEDIYHEWPFVAEVLYPCGRSLPADSNECPDSDGFIQSMRVRMLVLSVLCGAIIAWWGWQLGGRRVAVAATMLFCLDPNFLAHGALVKNDVPLTLIGVGLFLAVWRAGRRLTVANLVAIALLCAAAVTTKFSGLLFGPIVAILLLGRAIGRAPWPTFWRTLERRREKLVVVAVALLFCFVVSWIGTWAAYGFRFGPTTDPSISVNLKRMSVYTAMTELTMKLGHPPGPEEIEGWQPSAMTQAILAMDLMRALPQAWLNGLLYTYQSALLRPTYLLGEYSQTGWWYYFPVAIATKTPTATLLAAIAAMVVLVLVCRTADGRATLATWTTACLVVPPALFLASAMRSNLNLGLRHVLPVYPFLYLGIALAVGWAWRQRAAVTKWTSAVIALLVALETGAAFPNFIPFFNTPAGGARGGLNILGDSNLDWGQDLKLLAEWQQERRRRYPGEPLYLVYFGLADPWAYGIDYVNMPGGYAFGAVHGRPRNDPGVLAVSATALQGIYVTPDKYPGMRDATAALRKLEPLDVLGGSIYLYRWPLPAGSIPRQNLTTQPATTTTTATTKP